MKSVTCSTAHLSYRLYASLKDPTVWYSRQKMHFFEFAILDLIANPPYLCKYSWKIHFKGTWSTYLYVTICNWSITINYRIVFIIGYNNSAVLNMWTPGGALMTHIYYCITGYIHNNISIWNLVLIWISSVSSRLLGHCITTFVKHTYLVFDQSATTLPLCSL